MNKDKDNRTLESIELRMKIDALLTQGYENHSEKINYFQMLIEEYTASLKQTIEELRKENKRLTLKSISYEERFKGCMSAWKSQEKELKSQLSTLQSNQEREWVSVERLVKKNVDMEFAFADEISELKESARIFLREANVLMDYCIDQGWIDGENMTDGQQDFTIASVKLQSLLENKHSPELPKPPIS